MNQCESAWGRITSWLKDNTTFYTSMPACLFFKAAVCFRAPELPLQWLIALAAMDARCIFTAINSKLNSPVFIMSALKAFGVKSMLTFYLTPFKRGSNTPTWPPLGCAPPVAIERPPVLWQIHRNSSSLPPSVHPSLSGIRLCSIRSSSTRLASSLKHIMPRCTAFITLCTAKLNLPAAL